MSKSKYRLIRLVSGECLIAEIRSSTRTSVNIFRPYETKTIEFTNEDGQLTGEAMVLRSWSLLAKNDKSKIMRSHIISIDEPKDYVIAIYEMEKKKEDNHTIGADPKTKFSDKLISFLSTLEDESEELNDEFTEDTEDTEEMDPLLDIMHDEKTESQDAMRNLSELLKKIQNMSNPASRTQSSREKKDSVDKSPNGDIIKRNDENKHEFESDSDKEMFGW